MSCLLHTRGSFCREHNDLSPLEPIVSPKDFRLNPNHPPEAHKAYFIWEAVNTSVKLINGKFCGYKVNDNPMDSIYIKGRWIPHSMFFCLRLLFQRDWLPACLTDWLTDLLPACLPDSLTHWLTHWLTDLLTDWLTELYYIRIEVKARIPVGQHVLGTNYKHFKILQMWT